MVFIKGEFVVRCCITIKRTVHHPNAKMTATLNPPQKPAWVFHILPSPDSKSAVWAAQRVPENEVAVCANAFTIRGMNLKDTDNYLASPGIVELAERLGFYRKEEGEFDFTRAYGAVGGFVNVVPFSVF